MFGGFFGGDLLCPIKVIRSVVHTRSNCLRVLYQAKHTVLYGLHHIIEQKLNFILEYVDKKAQTRSLSFNLDIYTASIYDIPLPLNGHPCVSR